MHWSPGLSCIDHVTDPVLVMFGVIHWSCASGGNEEMLVLSLGQGDALEKEMVTHSSILAWKNPTERGVWWATICGVTKTLTWLSTHTHSNIKVFYPCCVTPWTVACQAPQSMRFFRQEYWNGLPCSPPGGSSQHRDRTQVSCIAGIFFTIWTTGEGQEYWSG